MLHASTRAPLAKFLSPSRLHASVHASSAAELTHDAWAARVRSQERGAGRTAEEAERERVREAEEGAVREGGAGEGTALFGEGRGRSGWTEGAVEAVRRVAEGEVGAAVRLVSCG